MKSRFPLLQWREKIQNLVKADCRIGDDLLLVEDNYWDPGREPFVADITYSMIITRGWTDMSINFKEYHIEAPSLVVILPGMITCLKRMSEDNDGFAVLMSTNFFNPIFNDLRLNTMLNSTAFLNPVSKIEYPEVFSDYKSMLRRILSSDGCLFKMDAARHLTLTMLYGYTLSVKHQAPAVENRNEEIANSFLDLVQQNYMEKRDVSSYADMLCITPKYLAMAVKTSTGRTPLDWIDEYTCSTAKALLSSTKLSVNEISEKLNFDSQALFGKYFKRITGISPREYRNSLIPKDKNSNN